MKLRLSGVLVGICLWVGSIWGEADSVVVFNEIMFHPASDEAGLEWIELHNQMSVNVELSGWSIAGGVTFQFPEGTVIAGGGYLVVSADPGQLAKTSGVTNALGPFLGRLSNGGDQLELRNRSQRVMDQLTYGVDGDWPVAPDGSGVSLAKADENSASAEPKNWVASARVGGTPGKRNFAPSPFEVTTADPLLLNGLWRWAPALDSSPVGWKEQDFDNSAWRSGSALFAGPAAIIPAGDLQPVPSLFSSGVDAAGIVLAPGSDDPHYLLTQSAQGSPPPPAVPALVIENHPAWAANDAGSSWIGVVNPGTTDVAAGNYNYQTSFSLDGFDPSSAVLRLQVGADNRLNSVLLNGVSKAISYVGFSALSGEFIITSGFLPGLNTLDFLSANDSTTPNPAGFRVVAHAQARKQMIVQTPLAPATVSYYFRSQFVVPSAPELSAIQLQTLQADGAVIYLNGNEILRLNMPAGPIEPSTVALSDVGQPALSGPMLLPSTRLVQGTNVLAVEVHRGPLGNNSVLFGAELSVTTTNLLVPPPVPLAFNEQSGTTNSEFWVELVNHGAAALDLSEVELRRQGNGGSQSLTLPDQTLAPGAFLSLDQTALGFRPDPGDRLFLYASGGAQVLDAVVVKKSAHGRFPDGTGSWHFPSTPTPGAPNQFRFQEDVVINEIFYRAPVPAAGSGSNGTQWIELFNRGAREVDLSGWALAGDIDFAFPIGTVLPVAGYLVLAKDVEAMKTENPTVDVVGPFQGHLGNEGTLLLLDAAGNPANQVRYLQGKPWPDNANGGGSSLELRDPWADNSRPEAWAASNETGRSGWTNYSYRGIASNPLGSTQWKEFVLGLLDAGECLIDDLSAIENPSGTAVSLLQNGSFETGLSAWRALGTHRGSRVEVDPENSTNHVLHLVATGATEHMHNHLETTLAGGRAVSNGREYQISFRAKWLSGNNRLNTRLYFNRVARTTVLAQPDRAGTPGARNSTAVPNLGPTFANLQHQPIVPKPNEAVTVRVQASDPQGVGAVTLWSSTDQASWKQTPMAPESAAGLSSYTNYSATLPGLAAGTLVQFFVQATDAQGATSAYPAAGADSRALFKVDDGKPAVGQLHRVRLLMTPADVSRLHASTNVMSNEHLGLTLVSDDQLAFYDVGVHLQGSERGRDDSSRVGFTIRFNRDQLYRGAQNTLTLDKSGGYSGRGGKHDELLLWHAVNHAGGLLGLECDLAQCYAPRGQEDGTALVRMSAFDGDYFDSQFRNGSEGQLYKLELIYYPTTSVGGNAQAPKLPQPDDVINVDIQNRGDDPESYRWIFLQENHADQDDYSQLIALNKAFSLSGSALEAQTSQLADVDEWMRTLAFKAFTGDVDTFTYGLNHNWQIYFPPNNGRALGLLWDMDFSFAQSVSYASPGTGSATTYKITRLPNNYRAFASHLLDLATTTFTAAYLQPWATHYAGLVGQNWSGAVSYLQQRAQYLRGTLPLNVPFKITTNAGLDFATTNNPVTLTGTAPLTVDHFVLNGIRMPVSWANLTNWTLSVPLTGPTNRLVIQGLDHQGNPLPAASASLTVIQLGAPALAPIVINEWMADNAAPGGFADPVSHAYSDWFELFNPNPVAVSLDGWYLTDDPAQPDKWKIPAGTQLGGRQFLLVWADNAPELNASDPGALHVNFQLNKGGDYIGLFGPNGSLQNSVTIGAQLPNISQGLFPDGNTNTIYSMRTWTPATPNSVDDPPTPTFQAVRLGPDGTISFQINALARRTYQIEFTDDLSAPVWSALGEAIVGDGSPVTITDPSSRRAQRFYRVLLVR